MDKAALAHYMAMEDAVLLRRNGKLNLTDFNRIRQEYEAATKAAGKEPASIFHGEIGGETRWIDVAEVAGPMPHDAFVATVGPPGGWFTGTVSAVRDTIVRHYEGVKASVLDPVIEGMRAGAKYVFVGKDGEVNMWAVVAAVALGAAGVYGVYRARSARARERALRAMVDRVARDPARGAAELAAFIDADPAGACIVLATLRAAAKSDAEAAAMARAVLVDSGVMAAAELQRHQAACTASGNKRHATGRAA